MSITGHINIPAQIRVRDEPRFFGIRRGRPISLTIQVDDGPPKSVVAHPGDIIDLDVKVNIE